MQNLKPDFLECGTAVDIITTPWPLNYQKVRRLITLNHFLYYEFSAILKIYTQTFIFRSQSRLILDVNIFIKFLNYKMLKYQEATVHRYI